MTTPPDDRLKQALSVPAVQRLEAWMQEISDLLAYQPEVPMAHKTAMIDALMAFKKEINPRKSEGD